MIEPTTTLLLYLPRWLTAEVEALARRLAVSPDTLLAASWEAAKPELHRAVMAAPAAVILASLSVPDVLPAEVAPLPHAPVEDERARRRVDVPPRIANELEMLAAASGQSASTLLAHAYELARDRLHHAKVTS